MDITSPLHVFVATVIVDVLPQLMSTCHSFFQTSGLVQFTTVIFFLKVANKKIVLNVVQFMFCETLYHLLVGKSITVG